MATRNSGTGGNGTEGPPPGPDIFDNLGKQANTEKGTKSKSPVAKLEREPDIFDNLDNIRAPEVSTVRTRTQILHVAVRKPRAHEFIRVHPAPDMSISLDNLYDDSEQEHYVVLPAVRDLIAARFVRPVRIVVCITRQGAVFLWPVPQPSLELRENAYNTTAREASELAKFDWVSVRSNQEGRCYDVVIAEGTLPEPVWPNLTLPELLRRGYRGKVIDSLDHLKVQALAGLI